MIDCEKKDPLQKNQILDFFFCDMHSNRIFYRSEQCHRDQQPKLLQQ